MEQRRSDSDALVPDASTFACDQIVFFLRLSADRPVSGSLDPGFRGKENGLHNQDAPNFNSREYASIANPFSNSSAALAHVGQAPASIAHTEALPRQPIRQPRIPSEKSESADRMMRRTELEEKRCEKLSVKGSRGGGFPKVNFVKGRFCAQFVVPVVVGNSNSAAHSMLSFKNQNLCACLERSL